MSAGSISVDKVLEEMSKYDPKAADIRPTIDAPTIDNDNREKIIRVVVTGSLKLIPKVGSLISGLISMIWPEPSDPQLVWKNIEGKVKLLAQELIDDERSRMARLDTEGLLNLLQKYTEESPQSVSKAFLFQGVLNFMTAKQPQFLHDPTPWKTLGSLVLFGTIHLALLREHVKCYDEIFKTSDPQPEIRKRDLKNAITKYTTAIDAAKKACLKERLEKIKLPDVSSYHVYIPAAEGGLPAKGYTQFTSKAIDTAGDIDQSFSWTDEDSDMARSAMKNQVFFNQHYQSVKADYTAQLDKILLPTFTWGRFDDDPSNDELIRYVYTGYMGSAMNRIDDDAAGLTGFETYFSLQYFFETYGPMTELEVFGDDDHGLLGLRIRHGIHDVMLGSSNYPSQKITMKDAFEYIQSAQVGLNIPGNIAALKISKTSNTQAGGGTISPPMTAEVGAKVPNMGYGPSVRDHNLQGVLYITGWYLPPDKGIQQLGIFNPFKRLNFVCGYPLFP